MGTMELLDELFEIRRKNTRTLADLNYEAILTQSMAAYARAAEGKEAKEQQALRETLGEFLLLRVAVQLRPTQYRQFVKMLRGGVDLAPAWGKISKRIPARFLKLRILFFMMERRCTLFFMNQYKIFEKLWVRRFFGFVGRVISWRSLEPFRYLLPGHLWLKSISVIITTKCTLRCKNCGQLMNLYQNPQDVDDAMILATLEKLQMYVDKINTLVLIGGEPFCNPNLKRYIEAVSSEVCKRIVIVTNGTLMPKDPEFFSVLKERHVSISFSNYGPLSRKQDEFIQLLEERNIPYTLQSKNMQWNYFGGWEPRGRKEKERNRQFARCGSAQCVHVLRGFVYICPRASHGDDLGLLKVPENERVDLLHLNKKEFIRQMKRKLLYRNKALTACEHCSYTDESMPVPRAEQME